jgi:diadenosine tetraphosphate (Ap4A) HIT family hydrolase
MVDFEIHEQLLADCHPLGQLGGCHLLLHRNAALSWFILVPETDVADLLDLAQADRARVIDQAVAVSGFIKENLDYPKVNFAALGNVVPQMHLHIIGRRPGDACWPAPVWGNLDAGEDYTPEQLANLREQLISSIGLHVEP